MIAPSDRGKVLGLGAGVVVVFGLLIWRSMAAMTPDGKPPEQVHVDTPKTSLVAVSGPDLATTAGLIKVETPSNASLVDPFRDVLPHNLPTAPRPKMFGNGPVSTAPILPFPGKTLTVAADTPPPVPKLTGVTSGNPSIGVFNVNGKEEIVPVGGRLSNGYALESIQGSIAVLTRGKLKTRVVVSP